MQGENLNVEVYNEWGDCDVKYMKVVHKILDQHDELKKRANISVAG